MNNNDLLTKRTLLLATTLSVMMLLASSMQPLGPTRAFAQEDEQVAGAESGGEETTTDEQGEETTSEGNLFDFNALSTRLNEDTQINVNSDSEEQTEEVEEGDLVSVKPIIQTTVQPDLNVNTNTHVITDEDDCQDASDEVNQANVQTSDEAGSVSGQVGKGSVHVSPIVQTSEKVALNVNVDTDVVVADCGEDLDASDEQTQANVQADNQEASRDLEVDEESIVIIPTLQNSGIFGRNIAVNNDVIRPVL